MTGQFFYTDPLKAAWMAKHFGMLFGFQRLNGEIVIDLGPIRPFEFEATEPRHWAVAKFIIYPGSLHLLEPQLWDLVFLGRRNAPAEHVVVTPADIAVIQQRFGDRHILENIENRIIQRNGIAFMWPVRAAV